MCHVQFTCVPTPCNHLKKNHPNPYFPFLTPASCLHPRSLPCAPGTYSSREGDSCVSCGRGFETGVLDGSTSCTVCAEGKFSSNDAVSFCSACAEGRWSPARSKTCAACTIGRYASGNGNKECTTCPFPSSSLLEESSTCESCVKGYHLELSTTGMMKCRACGQEGSFCPGDSVVPIPGDGYWSERSGSIDKALTIYKCARPTCKGGVIERERHADCCFVGHRSTFRYPSAAVTASFGKSFYVLNII